MQFTHLQSESEVKELIDYHNANSKYIVMDTETTDVNPHKAELVDVQLSGRTEDGAVMFAGRFLPLLESIQKPLVLHNFKYDYIVCKRHGWDMLGKTLHDTMIMSHLCDENRESHSLDSWVKERWNDSYKTEFWGKYTAYLDAPVMQRLDYSCRDIVYTGRLYECLLADCERERLDRIYKNVLTFARTLAETEYRGIAVDLRYLTEKSLELNDKINELLPQMRSSVELEASIWEMEAWEKELSKRKTEKGKANVKKPTFNFDSSRQLCTLFYELIGLDVCRNEKTHSPSVDDASLEKLKTSHSLVPLLQQYRGYKKVHSSFLEGTLERLSNGRIFPEFHINGTVTGRISSSNPNMQQLPRSGGIRGIYVPDPGFRLVSADYSQLEVTLAAHFSQDKNLLKIVLEGASQHDITAQSLGIPRQQAKTLNFAMQYRCSHFKVAKLLGVSEQDAKDIWYKYWRTYSGLKALMDKCDTYVDAGQPIINPFGRKRRFPVSEKRQVWDPAYRQAFNSLIQGTGADLTNSSLARIHSELGRRGIGRSLFVVHDETISQVAEGAVEEARTIIKDTMEGIGKEIELTVPLKVEVSDGMVRWED